MRANAEIRRKTKKKPRGAGLLKRDQSAIGAPQLKIADTTAP